MRLRCCSYVGGADVAVPRVAMTPRCSLTRRCRTVTAPQDAVRIRHDMPLLFALTVGTVHVDYHVAFAVTQRQRYSVASIYQQRATRAAVRRA